jgi:hypothetical protein
MRNPKITPAELLQNLSLIAPEKVVASLRAGLVADQLDFEMQMALKNYDKCREISDRMCDTEVVLCFIQLRNLT